MLTCVRYPPQDGRLQLLCRAAFGTWDPVHDPQRRGRERDLTVPDTDDAVVLRLVPAALRAFGVKALVERAEGLFPSGCWVWCIGCYV